MEKKISGKHGNRVAVMKERMAALVLASALLLGGGLTAKAQNTAVTTCSQSAATAIQQNPNWKVNAAEWQKLKGEITLYMTNDMGRNGYYDQKPIAELMGEMADVVGPECVIAAGDIHHFNGVASTQDPLWLTNYTGFHGLRQGEPPLDDEREILHQSVRPQGNHPSRGVPRYHSSHRLLPQGLCQISRCLQAGRGGSARLARRDPEECQGRLGDCSGPSSHLCLHHEEGERASRHAEPSVARTP